MDHAGVYWALQISAFAGKPSIGERDSSHKHRSQTSDPRGTRSEGLVVKSAAGAETKHELILSHPHGWGFALGSLAAEHANALEQTTTVTLFLLVAFANLLLGMAANHPYLLCTATHFAICGLSNEEV